MKPLWWMRGPMMDAATDGNTGGGGAPAFDAAKFKTELLGDVSKLIKDSLTAGFTNYSKSQAEAKAKAEADAQAEAERKKEEEAAAAAAQNQKVDPEVASLKRELAKLTKKNEEESTARKASEAKAEEERARNERNERLGTLRSELQKAGVAPDRIEAAVRIFKDDIKRADDGTLVGADDTPLSDWIPSQVKANEYLLPPKTTGGAGANAGGAAGKKGNEEQIDIEKIRPGMSAADKARARAQIAAIAQQALRGN